MIYKIFLGLITLTILAVGCHKAHLPWNASSNWDSKPEAGPGPSETVQVFQEPLEDWCEDMSEQITKWSICVEVENNCDWGNSNQEQILRRQQYLQTLIDLYHEDCA